MRILAPLRHPPLALVWSGLAFSALGDQLNLVALGWVAVDAFGPAAGYLSAAKAAIVLLTAAFGGSLADGWDRRRTMVGADLCRCLVLALFVLAWLAEGRPDPWLLGAAVVVLAAGEAFFEPALQTVLPALVVEPGLLVAANGLLDATDRLARLIGPGLIALAGAGLPPVHVFTLDAVSFLTSAAAVASVRLPRMPRVRTGLAPAGSLVRGFRAARREPLLGYLLAAGGLLNGVWYTVFFLAVPLAIGGFGASGAAGLGLYGLVFSCYGFSNLAANLIVGSRPLPARPAGLIFSGVAMTGAGIGLMALACTPLVPPPLQRPAFAAAAAVSGFGGPLKDIAAAALRQILIPAADIAAAMRASLIVNASGLLLAMLAAPAACAGLGAAGVMLAGAAAYGAVALAGWIRFAGMPALAAPPPARGES
ncbi:MFS transporter [Labrys wisconsinensis]|uniref:MFS family permease n=1 Tax=Labrys wisconsinensis TaxID=425677 RepID=A0ABU0JM45_9HYPH|nr:MFS transporter [Labrys wisconsinensis]MDQ0474556.1 MFS family permease [Labrys wisconsinensis]